MSKSMMTLTQLVNIEHKIGNLSSLNQQLAFQIDDINTMIAAILVKLDASDQPFDWKPSDSVEPR